MLRIERFLPVALCLVYCGYECPAAFEITQPTNNEQIFENANVFTKGFCNMGATVLIKLIEGGVNNGGTASETAPPQDIDWKHDFPAPQDHWTVSNNWKVHMYSGGVEVGTPRPYRIVAH